MKIKKLKSEKATLKEHNKQLKQEASKEVANKAEIAELKSKDVVLKTLKKRLKGGFSDDQVIDIDIKLKYFIYYGNNLSESFSLILLYRLFVPG